MPEVTQGSGNSALLAQGTWQNADGMETWPSRSILRQRRIDRLRSSLHDDRSGRVVFVSHCLLNQNTRYLGGAFRPGAVDEVVNSYLRAGTGICQMPCPEQLVWGGVLKRRLLFLYGRPWLSPVVHLIRPALSAYTVVRYRLLARRVASQLVDYQRSGFDVVGVVGVDASPTCGVMTTLDLDRSLAAVVACPLARLDRRFMNDAVLNGSARPGRGLFIAALSGSLAHRDSHVPLLTHDLRSEIPGSSFAAGPRPAGAAGTHEARHGRGRTRSNEAIARKLFGWTPRQPGVRARRDSDPTGD